MGYTPPALNVRKVAGNWFIDLETSKYIMLHDATEGDILYAQFVSPDNIIGSQNNRNIWLYPNGTGKVKFGTHTGSGDVACNGSIAILDAAGNARKLMTTA